MVFYLFFITYLWYILHKYIYFFFNIEIFSLFFVPLRMKLTSKV